VKPCLTHVLGAAAVSLTAACQPGAPPGGGDWPYVDTAVATVGATDYRLKLDGTVHGQGFPVNLTITAQLASPAPPSVSTMEVVLTLPGVADSVARATYSARWVAAAGQWEVEIRNAFPGPEPGDRIGRPFPAGIYLLRVDLFEGNQAVGQLGPLEVYLGFQRTRE
jgi:hypothetical protein